MLNRKSENPGILPEELITIAGKKILFYHFKRMLANENGTKLGKDIEALHDMRVATRRIRVALDLFENYYEKSVVTPIQRGMRRTGRFLGRVRDLDVFLEKSNHYCRSLSNEDHLIFKDLQKNWFFEREDLRQKMLLYLSKNRYLRLKQRLSLFLEEHNIGKTETFEADIVTNIAPCMIDKCFKWVLSFDSTFPHPSINQLHSLRIAYKQLRYVLEFFQEVLGGEAKSCIEKIKLIQDHLGDMNDAHVAVGKIQQLLDQAYCKTDQIMAGSDEYQRVVDEFIVYKQEELSNLVDSFPDIWKDFNSGQFEQSINSAISTGLCEYQKD